jgi:hypothetical protein
MRLLAQHNLSECQDMVEASTKAIEEWVPMMTALRRAPGKEWSAIVCQLPCAPGRAPWSRSTYNDAQMF